MSIKCEERFFESTDRKDRVRYLTWIDDSVETKGVALIAHGVCEHIDRFHGIGEHLAKAGYAVYGEDHVGHGKTAMGEEQNLRNIGKCPKGADKIVIKDMHKMRDIAVSEHPGLPEILVGHSMGSFVAKIYGATYGKELAATVYCGSGDFFGNPFRLLIYPLVPLFTAAPVKDLEIKVTNNMFSTGWLFGPKSDNADLDGCICYWYDSDPGKRHTAIRCEGAFRALVVDGEGRAWFGGHRFGGWGMLWRLGGSNPDRDLALAVVPAALLHQFEHVPAPLPPAPYRKVIAVD